MMTTKQTELKRENVMGKSEIFCANCKRKLNSNNHLTQTEKVNYELDPVFEIKLNLEMKQEEACSDDEVIFSPATQKSRTIDVKDALYAVYKLLYLDIFTSSTYVVQDNFLGRADEPVGVCTRCASVLSRLYRFYDEFNELREIDSYISRRVELLDAIIESQGQVRRSQDFSCVVPPDRVTEVVVEVDGDELLLQGQNFAHTLQSQSSSSTGPSYSFSQNPNCQVMTVVSEPLPAASTTTSSNNFNPIITSLHTVVATESLPPPSPPTVASPPCSPSSELPSSSAPVLCGPGPWVKLHRMTPDDVEKARISLPTSTTVTGRPARTKKSSSLLDSDSFIRFGDSSPIKEEESDSDYEFEGNENNAAEDEISSDGEDDEPGLERQRSSLWSTKSKFKTESRARDEKRIGGVVPTEEATIPCIECDEMFRSKRDLKKHISTTHPIKSDERLNCLFPNCLVTFQNISARNTHIKIYHRKANKNNKKDSSDSSVSEKVKDVSGNGTQFNCSFEGCLATFTTATKRTLHVKRNHEGTFTPSTVKPTKFKCEEEGCGLSFRDVAAREAHVKKKHLGLANPYECKYCRKAIRTRDLLYEHIKKMHPNYDQRGWTCKVCLERFNSRELLQDHAKNIHPDADVDLPSWPCFICAEVFRTRDERTDHLKGRHPGMRNRNLKYSGIETPANNLCPDCGKTFETRKQFTDHYKYHTSRNLKCDSCDKTFVRPFDLKRHQLAHKEIRDVICETCGKGFKDSGTLLYHHAKTCGPNAEERQFQCDQCGIFYKNKKSLEFHVLEHKGLLEKPYKCDLCDYRVQWPGILKYHRKKHFPVQEFACDICPAKFKHKNSLNLHQDVRHFGKRGKKCPIEDCAYVGMDKQSLEVHVRTKHTHERPYICSYCKQSFMKNSHKKRHEQIHVRENRELLVGFRRRRPRPSILSKRVKLTEGGDGSDFEASNPNNGVDVESNADAMQFGDDENVVEFYEVVI